jgi:hypothetical protein
LTNTLSRSSIQFQHSSQGLDWSRGLVYTYEFIEKTIGVHTHTQIIVLLDSLHGASGDVFRIRPEFPVKVHVVCVSSNPGESMKSQDELKCQKELSRFTQLFFGKCCIVEKKEDIEKLDKLTDVHCECGVVNN